jgi:hypothetical protein
MPEHLPQINQMGIRYTTEKEGVFYKVSELTPGFLNPATRSKEVKHYCLLKLEKRS